MLCYLYIYMICQSQSQSISMPGLILMQTQFGDMLGLAKEPRFTGMLAPNQRIAGSCEVEKFNDANKCQVRILLVTDLAVYNIQRNENFIKSMMSKLVTFQNKFCVRRRIPLEHIEAITISNQDQNEEFVLHVLAEHDYRFKMQEYPLKVSLLKSICLQYERLVHSKIAFFFKNDLTLADYCTHKSDLKSNPKAKVNKKPKDNPTYLNMQDLVDYQLPGVEFKAIHWVGDKPMPISKFKSSSIEKMKSDRQYFSIQTKSLLSSIGTELSSSEMELSSSEMEEKLGNKGPFIFLPSYCFQTQDKLYMLWPFSIGGKLHKVIQRVGALSEKLCIFYTAQLIIILQSLHQNNWAYCNLTLEELFIKENGYLWLNGINPHMKRRKEGQELSYDFHGKCPNIPPEMILMEGYSEAVDIWALGVCAFTMMYGYHPFQADNTKTVFKNILSGQLETKQEMPAFMRKTVVVDPKERISLQEIKKDVWFKDIDWKKLEGRELVAPYIPEMDSVNYWEGKMPSIVFLDNN